MQVMQRKFGKFLPRTADDAQVATLIADFYDADRALEKLIDSAKAWQQAWTDLLQRQSAMTAILDSIYQPIIAVDGSTNQSQYQPTPRETQQRITSLKVAYHNLKDDMIEEAQAVQTRIIIPAKEVRKLIDPYKKVIKKREDRKLDYERYVSRTDALQVKTSRTDRQNTALAKHRLDLEGATGEYETADQLVKSTLPQVTQLAFEVLPRLLNAQILIQNTLLAHLYTALHGFCEDHGLPSPAPDTREVIAEFEAQFTPLRLEMESSLRTISSGKAIGQPMGYNEGLTPTGQSGVSNGARRGSSQSTTSKYSLPPADYEAHSPQPPNGGFDLPARPRIPSSNTFSQQQNGMLSPRIPSGARTPLSRTPSGEATQGDYFASPPAHIAAMKPRQSSAPTVNAGLAANGIHPALLGKKKPPPPPPPKKSVSPLPQAFVIALYDFDGQGTGDLSFREGDRIKVVKKTDSNNDWWEGELRGIKGSFPANYVGPF